MRIDRQDLYALLRARNIPYEETAHPAVWSMEELHALCLPGEERILKNLFLRDDKKRRYYLVAIDGGRTADLKALRRTLDSRPLRFADAADLERLLGLLPGQVTPLGALRAPAGTVTVVLDAPLRGRTVGVHPLENTATTFLNLDDLAALLEDHGVPVIFVNYRKNMIKSYFTDTAKDYEINYVEENQPLGTAGSLRLIEEEFEQPFIVTNCDILIHADYEDVYRYHRESGNELTIVSALKNIVVPYGVIHSSENGAVQSMEEKPKLSYFVNTGMYILNPELKKEIPENTFYHMTDLTDKLLKENRKVGMYPISEDSFLDMGEFEEMHRMEKKLDLKSE